MTPAELRKSLNAASAPTGLSVPLQALWHEAKGNWEKAHHLVQDEPTPAAAWVHAHLHRKEGDSSNARYWYARAGNDTSNLDFDQEWDEIARTLLSHP
jgi:hypothetical protein